jgi:hypothetical protein
MTEYRDTLVSIHDGVAALKKEGKSLEKLPQQSRPQPTTANGLAPFIAGDVFTKLVYAGA